MFGEWTFTDHLGTPLLQTNSSKAVVWRAEYEPYGNVYAMRAGTKDDQPLRFPGQERLFDGSTGTEERYNVFRWYRSSWARFSQSDPIAFRGGLNLYSYVWAGNPLTWADPLGLKKVCCSEGKERLLKDAIEALDIAQEYLKTGGVMIGPGGGPVGSTYCLDNGGGKGTPVTFYDRKRRQAQGPCERACTRVHEASHADLCRRFGPVYWDDLNAKDEALAYFTEARCLKLAADQGTIDVEKDFDYLMPIP